MEAGLPIPRALERNFPPELIATPIEDIDPYYEDQRVSTALLFSATSNIKIQQQHHNNNIMVMTFK